MGFKKTRPKAISSKSSELIEPKNIGDGRLERVHEGFSEVPLPGIDNPVIDRDYNVSELEKMSLLDLVELDSMGTLTQMEQKFCYFYTTGVAGHKPFNPRDAAEAAGYKAPQASAYQLLKRGRVIRQIETMCDDISPLFAQKAMNALKTLDAVASSSEDDRARVQASNSILDRAGYKPVDRVVVSEGGPIDRDALAEKVTQIMMMMMGKNITPEFLQGEHTITDSQDLSSGPVETVQIPEQEPEDKK